MGHTASRPEAVTDSSVKSRLRTPSYHPSGVLNETINDPKIF